LIRWHRVAAFQNEMVMVDSHDAAASSDRHVARLQHRSRSPAL
jgi:hypothetical protein